ncbi:class I SAM-dependent methyltransferase [Ectobacillus ponti]|uniref:Class I SAM-dependent methyltransferase n=1 Tax=Ectobacillus ponti TaxID=2961894 RepID=A0AA42BRE7_9BACI|nr:class I SAM-dependent methyltransferase [Ectobacillus ponti]MCP8970857.1 class I SAM-dependent methyltransferase [Ectobacillus ponti]
MKGDTWFQHLLKQADASFGGWDFSYIADTGRMATEPLPWSYAVQAMREMKRSKAMLDMGTGGGEFLSRLAPLPLYTAATEAYPPNVEVARRRLEPLGVVVQQIENDYELPFFDSEFDLVINRHEAYAVSELKRILQPGGRFITQQVGGLHLADLNELLWAGSGPYTHWDLAHAAAELAEAGFRILEQQEAFPYQRFYDVGALVYYLKAIPWQVPDFTIEAYEAALYELHQLIEQKGYIEVRMHRFFLKSER